MLNEEGASLVSRTSSAKSAAGMRWAGSKCLMERRDSMVSRVVISSLKQERLKEEGAPAGSRTQTAAPHCALRSICKGQPAGRILS